MSVKMQTSANIVNQKISEREQPINVKFHEVLEMLDISVHDFINALGKFISSKSFANMVKKKPQKPTNNNEKAAYPELYLHVLINFIANSELSEGGYNHIIDQFLSGYNDDYHVDTDAIHC